MVSTQPAHVISKKGGDYRIQFKLIKQLTLVIWIYKLRNIVNPGGIVNLRNTLKLRSSIGVF